MRDLADELADLEAFRELGADARRQIAALCTTTQLAATGRVLEQGRSNRSLYFLRTGQVDVRLRRDGNVETIARLNPPAVLGEISFLTGRPCSADVDVVVDATFAVLSLDALGGAPGCCDLVIRAMALVLADRLHAANTAPGTVMPTAVVLLRPGAGWRAPTAFGHALARALAEARGGAALHVVTLPGEGVLVPEQRDARVWVATAGTASAQGLRSTVASVLPEWTRRYSAVVWSGRPGSDVIVDAVQPFASTDVALAGPGDTVPQTATDWLIQDAAGPTLTRQSVRHRLIADTAESERASAEGQPLPDRFIRTIDAIARGILGISVGWVLGAGGARGWSHIGVLEVLTRAGLPIDAIAGSSMGAIVGGLVAQGTPVSELRRVVGEWPKRRRQLRELRVWRMHMASERGIEDLLRHFFGERRVPELEIPYAANTVDIDRGEEVVITDGLLRDAARSSMAFPGWLPPFERSGRLFVDGATLNPVPVAACRGLGSHLLVAINVLGPPVPRPVPRRWPARQFDILARTFQLSGYSMGQAHGEQGDIVLTPDLGEATMTSFDRYDEMIAGGVREAELRLDTVLAAYGRRRDAVRAV